MAPIGFDIAARERLERFEQALCAQIGGDFWFPETGETARHAIATCQVCPCRPECLEEALKLPSYADHGVWGGLTRGERVEIRRDRAQKPGTPVPDVFEEEAA